MTPARKGRLGRGLGALLGEEVVRADDGERSTIRHLPRASIRPNPFQPRRDFDPEELADLRASIQANGLLQPLVVRPDPTEGGRYQLVAGERRFRALTELNWAEAPAVVREVDDRTLLVLALVENIQRSQLGPVEEAEGYQSLVEEFGLTQGEVAEAVGKSRSAVANMLRLLRLPPSVRRMLGDGALSMGHARALLSLDHPGRITDVARRAVSEGWSVRRVEDYTRKAGRTPPTDATPGRATPVQDPGTQLLEQTLQERLGTRVSLRSNDRGSGEIRIPFRSADDFDRLFQLITGEHPTDVVD
ncbi:MAG: ParB/RepB/Spo0J family partition protein [Gemmatimonadales bacterium]|nr:MAG: ParB/RepB/Spo0J family partition protein [Gemmatimonadales bacterium]